MTIERCLGMLAGEDSDSRIEMVQVGEPNTIPTLELRFQRYGEDLGWVTHKRIRMAPGQVGDLREALNLMDPDARDAKISASEKAAARSLRVVPSHVDERSSG